MNINSNIEISVDGAGGAAEALNKVSGGLANIGKEHEGLKGKFQERFQHLGLQAFAGEALRAQGVGMETRGVINILNTGLTALFGAGTLASGGILLAVTALVALAGIVQKVVEHQTKLNEESQKQIKNNEQLIQGYEKSAEVMKAYAESTSHIPGYIKEWAAAEKDLNEQTIAHQNTLLLENVAVMNQKIAKEQQAIDATKEDIATREAWLKANAGVIAADKNYAANTGNSVAVVDALNKKLKEQEEAFNKSSAELKKVEANVIALHYGYASAADAAEKLSKAAKEAADENTKYTEKSAEEFTKDAQEMAKKHADQLEKQLEDENAYYQELAKTRELNNANVGSEIELEEKHRATMMANVVKIEKDGYDTIMQAQAQAFAKMVVDGESFSRATAHIWKDLASQVIAQIEMMIAKYLVLMALTGGTGSFAAGSKMGKVFGMAEGGSVMVDRPTLFLAGEAGQPEVATFTPLSKMGGAGIGSAQYMGGGSGQSLSIGNIVTYVTGVQDPMAIANQVGQAIINRIRARGDLNFVRA